MADKIEIKSADELNETLTDLMIQTKAAKSAADAIEEKKLDEAIASLSEAQKKAQEDAQTINEGLMEQIKGLTLAFKTGWKQDKNIPEAREYKMGKLINTLFQAHSGSGIARRELNGMKEIRPVVSKESDWEERMETKTSATIATTPLSSDDSSTYYGSYLVTVEYIADMLRVAADASAMMPLVTHIPMKGITAYVPTTTDGFTFTKLTNQQTAKTEDTFTVGRATLTACVYALWMAISEEMDEDSIIALGQLFNKMIGEAWGNKYDDLALDDSTYGALALTTTEVVMDSGDSAYSDLDIDDLDNMIAALTTQTARQGARFFFHITIFDVIRSLKDANGNYIFQDAVNAAPATIRGYPFTISDGMPPLSESTAFDSFVLFGNPRHILSGDRVGLELKIFDTTMGTMQYDQIYLRARVRQAMTQSLPASMVKLTTAA